MFIGPPILFMKKLSKILGKLEIAVSLFSLALHGFFAAMMLFAEERRESEPVSGNDIAAQAILIFILLLSPSIFLLIGSILHHKKREVGGLIILLVAVPMFPVYLYLSFFSLYGVKSLLSAQFIGIVTFLLIPISMFILTVAQATAINSLNEGTDLN